MWPALHEARDNAENIRNEIEKLLKNHSNLTKGEIAKQKLMLIDDFSESLRVINEEIKFLKLNLKKHRKYIESKSEFMKRHYKRV